MGGKIRCFFLEPSEVAEESFRRYASSSENKCSNVVRGYHNASVLIGTLPWINKSYGGEGNLPSAELKQDPRWPKKCDSCSYEFTDEDCWQHNITMYHRRSDNGDLVTIREAPVGAMWYADWMGDRYRHKDDGHALVVKTPGGDWCVDGPSSNGPGWVRTGEVPRITAAPSILIGEIKTTDGKVVSPGYHGYLKDGYLEEC